MGGIFEDPEGVFFWDMLIEPGFSAGGGNVCCVCGYGAAADGGIIDVDDGRKVSVGGIPVIHNVMCLRMRCWGRMVLKIRLIKGCCMSGGGG